MRDTSSCCALAARPSAGYAPAATSLLLPRVGRTKPVAVAPLQQLGAAVEFHLAHLVAQGFQAGGGVGVGLTRLQHCEAIEAAKIGRVGGLLGVQPPEPGWSAAAC